jgi:hypothetical protein
MGIVVGFEVITAVTSGKLLYVALVRTDVSEEPIATFTRVERIAYSFFLARATRRHIPEEVILHGHHYFS